MSEHDDDDDATQLMTRPPFAREPRTGQPDEETLDDATRPFVRPMEFIQSTKPRPAAGRPARPAAPVKEPEPALDFNEGEDEDDDDDATRPFMRPSQIPAPARPLPAAGRPSQSAQPGQPAPQPRAARRAQPAPQAPAARPAQPGPQAPAAKPAAPAAPADGSSSNGRNEATMPRQHRFGDEVRADPWARAGRTSHLPPVPAAVTPAAVTPAVATPAVVTEELPPSTRRPPTSHRLPMPSNPIPAQPPPPAPIAPGPASTRAPQSRRLVSPPPPIVAPKAPRPEDLAAAQRSPPMFVAVMVACTVLTIAGLVLLAYLKSRNYW